MSIKLKKGSTVRVISGNCKGSTGKVLAILKSSSRVVVEGVNLVKRASKRTQNNPQGGFVERESSVHVSNVKVVSA